MTAITCLAAALLAATAAAQDGPRGPAPRARSGAKKTAAPQGRLVGDSGWRVAEPAGFTLESDEGRSLLWRRIRAVPMMGARPAPGVRLSQEEVESIQVWYEQPRKAPQCDPASSGKPIVEGSHYGKPTLSFECALAYTAPMHFYTLVIDGAEQPAAIHMSYSHEWGLPKDQQGRGWPQSKRPPKVLWPSLKLFRQLQGTLAPIDPAPPGLTGAPPAGAQAGLAVAPGDQSLINAKAPREAAIKAAAARETVLSPRAPEPPRDIPAPAPPAERAPAAAPPPAESAPFSLPPALLLVLATAVAVVAVMGAWLALSRGDP